MPVTASAAAPIMERMSQSTGGLFGL